MNAAFQCMVKTKNSIMNSIETVKILLSSLRFHSTSSIQIPQSTNRYYSMLSSVYVSPLKLHSATKTNLQGVSDSAPVHRNSRSTYKRSVVYPSFSKCNARGVAVANIYVVNHLLNLT